MNDDSPRQPPHPILQSQIEEMKDGIARMIEPHALPGSGGVITLALLELGIERHLQISPHEKSARAFLDGVSRKVLERHATRHGH